MFITGPAFMILLLLGLLVIWLYVELGSYPGKVARRRGHPQADAINVLGWLGPLALTVAEATVFPSLSTTVPETDLSATSRNMSSTPQARPPDASISTFCWPSPWPEALAYTV